MLRGTFTFYMSLDGLNSQQHFGRSFCVFYCRLAKFTHWFYALYINQGTTVRVEYGDVAIAADPAGAHVISHAFPHTYGQPIAHFLRKTAVVPDAKVISEHPAVRYDYSIATFLSMKTYLLCKSYLSLFSLTTSTTKSNHFVPCAGLALSSVEGSLLEATMSFGDCMRLSRPTTKTANSLVFLVSNLIFCTNYLRIYNHRLACEPHWCFSVVEFSWQLLMFFCLYYLLCMLVTFHCSH